jgi:hypothetical protein
LDEIKPGSQQAHREVQRLSSLHLGKLLRNRRTANPKELASLTADGDLVIYVQGHDLKLGSIAELIPRVH